MCKTNAFFKWKISLSSKRIDKGRSEIPTPPGYMHDPPKEDVRTIVTTPDKDRNIDVLIYKYSLYRRYIGAMSIVW